MENNKKHMPDYEISTYSKRTVPVTDYTYSKSESNTSSNPLDAYRQNHSNNRKNIISNGGTNDGNHKTNK